MPEASWKKFTLGTGIVESQAKTSDIPSPGWWGECAAKTNPLSPSVKQKKKKKVPDITGKGNTDVLGSIIPVLTVLSLYHILRSYGLTTPGARECGAGIPLYFHQVRHVDYYFSPFLFSL